MVEKGLSFWAGILLFLGIIFTSFSASAQIQWTNLANGNWGDSSNWKPTQVPEKLGDQAVIVLGSFVQINVDGFYAPDQIVFDSAFMSIGGSGGLTTGELDWGFGTFNGPMVITVTSTLEITGDPGQDAKGLTAVLVNSGTGVWSDASLLSIGGNGCISNLAGATFTARGGGSIGASGLSPNNPFGFFNAGTLAKSVSSVTNIIGVPTCNTNGATIHVAAGGLEFTSHLESEGSISVDTNANLLFQAGGTTFDLSPASDLSGQGTVWANFGTLNVAGGLDLYQLTLNGGTVNMNGTNEMFVSVVNLTNGTLGGTNFLEVGDQFNWAGGDITGSNSIISENTLNLLGKNMVLSGRTFLNLSNAIWTNNFFLGTASIDFNGGSIFSNEPGSSFSVFGSGNESLFQDGGIACRFDNGGVFMNHGDGFFTSSIPFDNSGLVQAFSGYTVLNGGGTNSGAYQILGSANLDITGGTFLFDTNSMLTVLAGAGLLLNGNAFAEFDGSITDLGTTEFRSGTINITGNSSFTNLLISGATANFNGTNMVEIGDFALTNGTLGGTNEVVITNDSIWSGGTIKGQHAVDALNGIVISNGAGNLNLSGRFLEIFGSNSTWTGTVGGTITVDGNGAFVNQLGSTMETDFDGTVANGSSTNTFANVGTFKKTAGLFATTIGVQLDNVGTIEVAAAALDLNGGGTSEGIINVDSGALLGIGGGAIDFQTNSQINISPGAGLAMTAGTANFEGQVNDTGGAIFTGGTANITGFSTFTSLTNSGGTVNINGTNGILLGDLVMKSGTLGGTSAFNVTNNFDWSGGNITGAGQIFCSGGINISNTNAALNMTGRFIVNLTNGFLDGLPNLSLTMFNGAEISNAVGGILYIVSGGSIGNGGGAGGIVNAGLVEVNGGTNTMTIAVPYSNTGTSIVAGAIALTGGSASSGLFTVVSNATLGIGGGTHNFNPGSVTTGSGSVSISGVFNLFGILTSNIIDVVGGGIVNFDGTNMAAPSALNITNGTVGGSNNVTVTGIINWLAGTLNNTGSITAGALAMGNGNGNLNLFSGTLVNASNATWNGTPGGSLTFANSGQLVNNAGATFDSTTDQTMVNSSGANQFVNKGLFRKTGGTGMTLIGIPFSNTGTTIVQTASINLGAPVTSTGTITVNPNSLLILSASGNTQNYNPGSIINGGGTVSVTGGTVNLAGTFVSNTLNIANGATVNFNGTNTAAPAAFNITNGIAGGSNTVTVNGPMNWLLGNLNGTGHLTANGGLTMGNGNSGLNLFGWSLVNASNATWAGTPGGSLTIGNGGQFINNAGSTFDNTFDGSMGAGSGANQFVNNGLFRKTGGSSGTFISVPFVNTGTTVVQTASITLAGQVTSSGTITVNSNQSLVISASGNTQNYNPGSVINGGGSVSVTGGTVNFAGDFVSNVLNIANGATVNFNGTNLAAPVVFRITNGIVGGSNLVMVSGPMVWQLGNIGGTNSILAKGGLTMGNGNFNLNLTGRTLVNASNCTWIGTPGAQINLFGGAIISNMAGGTFDCTFDGNSMNQSSGSELFANAGLFRKSAGAGSTLVSVPFKNSGTVQSLSGMLNFFGQPYTQTAGMTIAGGGVIANSQALQIQGGSLTGNGIVQGSVNNAGGIVDPGTPGGVGQLVIGGAYTQATNGSFNLEIAGTNIDNGYSTLFVSNTAALNGALNVSFTNGFTPATNSSFTFLLCSNRVGTFTNFNYPSNSYSMALLYSATNVTLLVTGVNPHTSSIKSLQVGNPGKGSNTLSFSGAPGSPYAVQAATNVAGPYLDFSTNVAGTNGAWIVIDPFATNATRFYRVRSLSP